MKKYLAFIVMLVLFGMNEAMGQWLTSGSNIYNSNTGNVGIGNSSPATLLHVAKNMTEPTITVQNLGGNGGATYTMIDNASGANWKFKATLSGGFKIRDHANGLDVFLIEPNSSANSIYIKSGGNVGFGITSPQQQLDIAKSIQMPFTINDAGNNGVIYKNGFRFIHDASCGTYGYNTFMGIASGTIYPPGMMYGGDMPDPTMFNTGFGAYVLQGVLGASRNTGIGSFALYGQSYGWANTASGFKSLYSNVGGNHNTASGSESMFNSNGSFNTGYGAFTLFSNVAGSGNVALGYQAGYNETGSNKLYIENSNSANPLIGGDFSLDKVTINGKLGIGTSSPAQQLDVNGSVELPITINSSTGVLYKGGFPFLHDYRGPIALGFNTFLGQDAGNFTMGGGQNYHGCNNTGLGFNALHGVTTGYANTGVGVFALTSTAGGYENTAVGLHSMIANTSGNKNTALGYMAGHDNTNGSNNIVIGYNSNYYNQSGGNNTIIGYEAGKGSAVHNKSGNIFIGSQAGFNETGSNKLYIENTNSSAPLIGGDFDTDKVFLNAVVGIGTSSPAASAKLEIAGTDKGFLPPRLTTAQIDAISGPAAGLMVYNTSLNKPQFYDGTEWRSFDGTRYLSESYGGGIVFYIDGTGQHGLIASPTDQGVASAWGCVFTFIGATSTAIGSGQANTTTIVNGCAESGIAARICNDLVLNGYNDWFLPSFDELNQMYEQRIAIGAGNWIYWSSSEVDLQAARAISFADHTILLFMKDSPVRVRAIRAF